MNPNVYILTHLYSSIESGTNSTMFAIYTEPPTESQLTEHLRVGLKQIDAYSEFPIGEIVLELLTSPGMEYIIYSSECSSESIELRKIQTNTSLFII